MERNYNPENRPKLPHKKTLFLEIPEESSFFLDYVEDLGGHVFLRIENMEQRIVIPVGPVNKVESYFGAIIDDYFAMFGN